ncbi:hypothetical protein DM02DRAFT_649678 [Periconia macrospinosa]|uniref:Protein Asterix n=1 Tax=Periconia macrospinosa TaxID=97972 RepID=A0A2V1E851_9PLEO|nr:hypothetical protein DM02DRAFT_649678 [Periconia macrospinosa]
MASKKDMRRADLIVPYSEPAKDKNEGDMASTMASTLPMAATVSNNTLPQPRMIGWVAVVFAIQSWLAESPEQSKNSATPAYFSVGMSLMSLLVGYVPLFLPPQPVRAGTGSGTEAPPAAPPS